MDKAGAKRPEAGRLAGIDWRWIAAGVFALAVFARLLPGPRTIDDSFITYRYARNLLAGEGFVYNPGERVLGTTTPLYTALMALVGSLAGGVNAPFPQLSMLINALADGMTCLLLLQLGRRLGYRYAGLGAALAWAIAPFSVTFAIGGLETSVYILLLTGLTYTHISGRNRLTAFLAALAYLTRPDALILISLVGLDRLMQVIHPKRPDRPAVKDTASKTGQVSTFSKTGLASHLVEAFTFLAPVLVWTVFAWLYFGSPLPHSMAAKTVAYRLLPEEGLVRLLQHYGTPFMEHLTFSARWIAIGLPLYLFLYLVGALQTVRRSARAWPFAAYPWLYLIVFAAVHPLIFRWYLSPPLPAYFFFILAGAQHLLTGADHPTLRVVSAETALPDQRRTGIINTWVQMAGLIVIVLLPAGLSIREWRLHPDHGLARPAPEMAWYKLELLYRQVADELKPKIQASAGRPVTLAAGDVGVLGFFSGARILDTVGLNSPVSSRYYPLDPELYVINYAIPPDLILDQQPDYVVILEVYGRLGLLRDPRFQEAYRLRRTIPTDIYGSDGLLVFERK